MTKICLICRLQIAVAMGELIDMGPNMDAIVRVGGGS